MNLKPQGSSANDAVNAGLASPDAVSMPIFFSGESSGISLVKTLRVASLVLTVLIFFLISLGGMVRNAGAGLSCPDWPLCYGKVVPPMDYQVFLEWFHRLIAGSVSTLLLAISAAIVWKKELRSRYAKHCLFAIALLMAQVVLGGLTVLGLLDPKWVSSHLAVGMAFYGTILLLAVRLFDHEKAPSHSKQAGRLSKLAVFATLSVYVQILLGGLVSSNYAGLACAEFPTCNGSWFPPFEGLVRFQLMHRVGAFVAMLAVGVLSASAVSTAPTPRAKLALRALSPLLGLQILLGISSVFLQLPLPMSVAHLGTAAALFGMLLVTTYELKRNY